jgi:hypothetical protein
MSASLPQTTATLPKQSVLFRVEGYEETSDDYWTPPWLFDQLDLRFDIDVAAPPGGIPWVPAERSFSMADDGLSQPWTGRVWMNPPYSNPTPWVDRFLEHGNGVALIPTSTGAWFLRLWGAEVAFVALPNMRFYRTAGPMPGYLPIRCWLVAAGEENCSAIAKLGYSR